MPPISRGSTGPAGIIGKTRTAFLSCPKSAWPGPTLTAPDAVSVRGKALRLWENFSAYSILPANAKQPNLLGARCPKH